QLLAAPAVAQRHGDRALGVVLADDIAVELGDDLARAEGRTLQQGHLGLSNQEMVTAAEAGESSPPRAFVRSPPRGFARSPPQVFVGSPPPRPSPIEGEGVIAEQM